MAENDLRERLLTAWTDINARMKNSQMTQGFTYNEAVTMKLIYDQYRRDGVGLVPVAEIRKRLNMLKSLAHRTIQSLCEQGYLQKETSPEDARALLVRPVPERLPDFLAVHERSLQMAQAVIDAIGQDEAERFVRCCDVFLSAGLPF